MEGQEPALPSQFEEIVQRYGSDPRFRSDFDASPRSALRRKGLDLQGTGLRSFGEMCERVAPAQRRHVVFGLALMLRSMSSRGRDGAGPPGTWDVSELIESTPLADLDVPAGFADAAVAMSLETTLQRLGDPGRSCQDGD